MKSHRGNLTIYIFNPAPVYFMYQRYYFDGSLCPLWSVLSSLKPSAVRSQEADTDDQQGTLTYEEFSVFYKMMSLRRDVFLLMMAYSDRKDHLTADELANFLRNEQKVRLRSPPGAGKALGLRERTASFF